MPGRVLALALALLVLGVVWVTLAAPLIDWHADRAAALEQRGALVRRMAELAASLPNLQAQLAHPAEGGKTENAALPGESDAIAGADLQQRVQEMANRAGVTLSSTRTLPATSSGDYRRIGLHMSSTATGPVLIALLLAIDQAAPRMLVDDLQLRSAASVVQPVEPTLEVSFTIYAFRDAATPIAKR